MAEAGKIDPIHQFEIHPVLTLGPLEVTNSALFMFAIVGLAAWLFIGATASRSLVPGRFQSVAEMLYEFVVGTVRSTAGDDGVKKFLPFVFTLFVFVLFANMIGMLPFAFTVTSHIIVTAALALLVIGTVIVYGFVAHGTHFLHLFVPSGVSPVLLPFIVMIEVISFLSRPISLSVRLFANMLAGHITLKVFGGFVGMLLTAGGAASLIAPLPLAAAVALTAFEFMVAFLQAYVFAILTCVYLNDALHPGH